MNEIKGEIQKELMKLIREKIQLLQETYKEVSGALESEAKSTAGDKHETGRAMTQLEQEKIAQQIGVQEQMLLLVKAIKNGSNNSRVQNGSLVELPTGWFFISVGIGKIKVSEMEVYCINSASPVGQQLMNKIVGESINFNGQSLPIISVL